MAGDHEPTAGVDTRLAGAAVNRSDAAGTAPARQGTSITWRWERHDHHRVVTAVGVVGLAVAVAMAVFGLPPVDLHGPFHRFGIMDPLCGGTRAARYTTQGEFALAWRYNPLGIVTVAAAVVATLRLLIGLTVRRWLNVYLSWTPRTRRIAIAVGIIVFIVLTVRQQMRADLLMQDTWVIG